MKMGMWMVNMKKRQMIDSRNMIKEMSVIWVSILPTFVTREAMRDRGKQELKAMNVKGESEVESVVQINGTGKSNLSDTN
jgi:hypothetical protein